MRDLELWRRLDSGVATLADLAEIATLPLSRRCAYVGPALRLVTSSDVDTRVAALRLIAGSRGVEGVRAIVAALADADDSVRTAAVDALRETSRDAPLRYVHALFHPRADVRQRALAHELAQPTAELATYLRADPATTELAASRARWPADSLRIAFALYADGFIPAEELVAVCGRAGASTLLVHFEKGQRRLPAAVGSYIDAVLLRGANATAPEGADGIDIYVRALAACPFERRDDSLELTVAAATRPVVRRIIASLLVELLRGGGDGALWGMCIAFEPRLLAMPGVPTEHMDVIVDFVTAIRGPMLTDAQLEQLLRIPVAFDLALGAALVHRGASQRLKLLAKVRGEVSIIESLLASDRGWVQICRIPPEVPPLEIGWLQQIEKRDYKRYVVLAGIALRVFNSTRQSLFIEQLPRRHRPAVFLAALLSVADKSDERILALARTIAPRVDRTILVAILPDLLDHDASGRLALGICRYVTDSVLGAASRDLSAPHIVTLVALLDKDPIPRDRELALAGAIASRGIPEVADWCSRVTSILTSAVATPVAPIVRKKRDLSIAEERAIIAAGSGRALDTALTPAIGQYVTGLVRALDTTHAKPHVWACVALLSCADRLDDVTRLLDRWSEPTPAFETAVDNAINSMAHADELPPLARARLWRWERQQLAFLDWVEAQGGAFAVLTMADSMRRRFARNTLWHAVSEGLMLLRYRNLPRFLGLASLELAQYAAERIDEPIGRHAARMVVSFVESGVVPVAAVRDRVLDRVADADGETRSYVARLVRLEGVPEAQHAAPPPPVNIVDDIRTSSDLDSLAQWCHDPRPAIVQEAALALVALGPAGQLRLAEVLATGGIAVPVPILSTIVLWDHAPALDAVRALARRDGLDPSWQFHLSLALLYRGENDALERALAAVRSSAERWHFRRADWDALVKIADRVTCSIALADSPHHHAYQRAANVLLSLTRPTPEVHDALVRFLEIDSDRPLHLRMAAARYIARHWGDMRGLPLLVEEICDPPNAQSHELLADVPDAGTGVLAATLVDAALVGGNDVCSDARMWSFLEMVNHRATLTREVMAELRLRVFEGSMHAGTRRQAAHYVMSDSASHARLRRVAEVFAWGVRRGAELTGRMFSFHMTSKEGDLGHTRLSTTRIFVSPLPMLRDETNGQDIVEGLVLHEIGHHVYHRGQKAEALWKKAHAEGIGHFLNLIADEHLERNLRAVDPAYGDRLKRLGAYAFHHAPQEMKVQPLCEALGASTAHALIHADLGVAFDEESVRLRRGAILAELDRIGHPVARFSRALRMGLGNRAGDPLNAAALALCGKELRALDMQGLYDLTVKLTELFGGRVHICKVFGGPEGLVFGERDDDVFGAGIDDDILQREIERILEPPGNSRSKPSGGGRLAINVNPDLRFEPITKIVRVQSPTDQELYNAHARQVARHSARLRGYLDDLGLRWLPSRARTQGRALDKTRLRALVTRNDPRILVARTPVRRTDLFVGTIVDCSGSMQARENIARARRFAVLVAEAVKNLEGVAARFFGFTDSVIYDAGDKHDCHVMALEAGGGNNDAAALYHAANVALAAPQRAKVLIMISDGLPTECSVAALRNLVTELTRKRGIVCAQVGVIDLEEICFPHYVLINDDQLDVAVAKFGRMIAELARRSLSS